MDKYKDQSTPKSRAREFAWNTFKENLATLTDGDQIMSPKADKKEANKEEASKGEEKKGNGQGK
jgi:hypothetical protein